MKQLGRYRVLEEIARGGMGVVYRGHDPVLGHEVAIKVLIDLAPDPRFLQEARAAAALEHPGIVRVHDFEKDPSGREFLVMEWVAGESLRDRTRREGPLPIDEAVEITLRLCEAMSYAHGRGVIHRDLKPHNVLLTLEGRVKITDFGMGKVLDQSQCLTNTGDIMGTPAYMPPEQAKGDKAAMGPRSDVYGLGATFYALLTGRAPFQADTPVNLLFAVLGHDPEPPSKLRPEVPPELDAVVLRCLAKRPQDRYASAGDLAEALAGKGKVTVAPPTYSGRVGGPRLFAAAIVILGLVGAVAILRSRQSPDPATTSQPAIPVGAAVPRATEIAADPPRPQTSVSRAPGADVVAKAKAAVKKGTAAARAGRHREAVDYYTEAIRLTPHSALAFRARGAARGKLGDFSGLLQDYTEAVRIEPGDTLAYVAIGMAHTKLGDHQSAIDAYTEVIRLGSDLSRAYYGRAGARGQLGDYQGQVDDYTEAIRIHPGHAPSHYYRGVAQENLGQLQEAINDWGRALELDPNARWASQARQRGQAARLNTASGE